MAFKKNALTEKDQELETLKRLLEESRNSYQILKKLAFNEELATKKSHRKENETDTQKEDL